jgi:hypothetical protein
MAVTVISKKPNSIFAAVDTFYFTDKKLASSLSKKMNGTPWIVATIYDENNQPIEKQCYFYQEVFAGDGARGFEILGNKQVSYDLEIKIPAGSKLANKILAANKIELSTSITQECQS